MNTVGFDPTNTNHVKSLFTVGAIYWLNGIPYRYMQAEDANIAAGNVICWSTTAGKVTADIAGGTSTGKPAGVAQCAVTDGYFGFFQCGGLGQVAIVTDGAVAADDFLIPHASTNGAVDTGTLGTNDANFLGKALVDDTSTALAAGEYELFNLM